MLKPLGGNCAVLPYILDVYKRQLLVRGRGALCKRRNSSGSGCGVYRSENAGMSSANDVRIIMAGNLRFLEEGSSAPS